MVFERQQPGQWKAGALALLVHVLFLGLMVFSVSWQNQEPSGIQVELWSEVPAPAKVAPPPKKPEPAPKPKPEPKPEPKPKPVPPEPKPESKQVKADIELKAKEEEKKKRREEELKQQKEKQKLEEEKRKQKLEEEKRKQELDKKLQQEKQEALRQLETENARKAELAAAGQRLVDDYRGRIQAKIKRFIILPPELAGNPQAEFDVTLMPTGDVLHLKLTKSSGSSAYDSAVERAVYKAQPLPLPPDPGQFGKFRELHLKFKPRED
ncbi:MAG: cell envelope integrity protein TolA [Sulfurimicrobium sp.]|nr:cell envelope integrity protein TolA [Sulfurimicrobium sp.]